MKNAWVIHCKCHYCGNGWDATAIQETGDDQYHYLEIEPDHCSKCQHDDLEISDLCQECGAYGGKEKEE